MSNNDNIIEVEGLSKQYRLGEVSTGTISHDLNRLWCRLRGKEDPYLKVTHANVRDEKAENLKNGNSENLKSEKADMQRSEDERSKISASQPFSISAFSSDYVWALQDINFSVKRGEVLGIIGRNGAGKSTLLKILSRVTAPTTGEIRVDGRIASLLEVGTGFHPELTGRENIYLNGAILGMTKAEIRNKLDEIVDFSGCARYLDTPTKRYSSGMVVRLGFAVAAHLEPEILIVDEVLAVGDFEFQAKCLGKMNEVASQGRTVLFVSHNLASIQNLCQFAIWLDGGAVALQKGDVAHVVSAYEESGRVDSGVVDVLPRDHRTVSPFQIQRVETLGEDGAPTPVFKYGEPICIRLKISCKESMKQVQTGISISSNGVRLTTMLSENRMFKASDSQAILECIVPGGVLLPGVFHVGVGASRSPGNIGLDYVPSVTTFSVSDVGVSDDWKFDRKLSGTVSIGGLWR